MAAFQKRGTRWRAIVRKKGHPAQSKTFSTKARAQAWAKEIEGKIEDGAAGIRQVLTLGELLDAHLVHLDRISSRGRKNKTADNNLRKGLGAETLLSELNYKRLAEFCATRLDVDGVKPATVMVDIMHLSGAITTGTIEDRVAIKLRQDCSTWIKGLRRAGLIGNPEDRDRRPTEDELNELLIHTKHNRALRRIAYHDLIEFAVESSMRLDEICSLEWRDFKPTEGTVLVRLRKHPKEKTDQWVPLMGKSQAIIERREKTYVFPWQMRMASFALRHGPEWFVRKAARRGR